MGKGVWLGVGGWVGGLRVDGGVWSAIRPCGLCLRSCPTWNLLVPALEQVGMAAAGVKKCCPNPRVPRHTALTLLAAAGLLHCGGGRVQGARQPCGLSQGHQVGEYTLLAMLHLCSLCGALVAVSTLPLQGYHRSGHCQMASSSRSRRLASTFVLPLYNTVVRARPSHPPPSAAPAARWWANSSR